MNKLPAMSFAEIKDSLVALPPEERDKASAFLGYLRRGSDPEYRAELAHRSANKDPSYWLTLEEVERRLDQE